MSKIHFKVFTALHVHIDLILSKSELTVACAQKETNLSLFFFFFKKESFSSCLPWSSGLFKGVLTSKTSGSLVYICEFTNGLSWSLWFHADFLNKQSLNFSDVLHH